MRKIIVDFLGNFVRDYIRTKKRKLAKNRVHLQISLKNKAKFISINSLKLQIVWVFLTILWSIPLKGWNWKATHMKTFSEIWFISACFYWIWFREDRALHKIFRKTWSRDISSSLCCPWNKAKCPSPVSRYFPKKQGTFIYVMASV